MGYIRDAIYGLRISLVSSLLQTGILLAHLCCGSVPWRSLHISAPIKGLALQRAALCVISGGRNWQNACLGNDLVDWKASQGFHEKVISLNPAQPVVDKCHHPCGLSPSPVLGDKCFCEGGCVFYWVTQKHSVQLGLHITIHPTWDSTGIVGSGHRHLQMEIEKSRRTDIISPRW